MTDRDDEPIRHDTSPTKATLGGAAAEWAPDPVIAALKRDVDRTLLIDNLRRTFDQRARRMNEFHRALDVLRASRPTGRG